MLNDYIAINGTEFLFSPRALGYIKYAYPNIDIKCNTAPNMSRLLGGAGGFQTPSTGVSPPWRNGAVKHSADFFGGMITGITGLADSTHKGNFTELKDEGAVHHQPHFGAKEVRITATLYARDSNALSFGLDWVKSTIDDSFCGTGFGADCNGSTLEFLTSDVSSFDPVESTTDLALITRQLLDVKVLSGVKVVGYPRHRKLKAVEIEFILLAGTPFTFNMYPSWTSTLVGGTPGTAIPEVACDPVAEAYNELITDPQNGTVVRPPRPPVIAGAAMPNTWTYRHSTTLPSTLTNSWGQLVFHTVVRPDAERRQLRLRVYPSTAGVGGCGYSGEIYITYIPANYTLTIDGRNRDIYMTAPGSSKKIPAANLVVGSAGRPLKWPVVDCRTSHRIEFDVIGSNTALDATVKAYLRR